MTLLSYLGFILTRKCLDSNTTLFIFCILKVSPSSYHAGLIFSRTIPYSYSLKYFFLVIKTRQMIAVIHVLRLMWYQTIIVFKNNLLTESTSTKTAVSVPKRCSVGSWRRQRSIFRRPWRRTRTASMLLTQMEMVKKSAFIEHHSNAVFYFVMILPYCWNCKRKNYLCPQVRWHGMNIESNFWPVKVLLKVKLQRRSGTTRTWNWMKKVCLWCCAHLSISTDLYLNQCDSLHSSSLN